MFAAVLAATPLLAQAGGKSPSTAWNQGSAWGLLQTLAGKEIKGLRTFKFAGNEEQSGEERTPLPLNPCSAQINVPYMYAQFSDVPTQRQVEALVLGACIAVGKCTGGSTYASIEKKTLASLKTGKPFFNTVQHTLEGHDQFHQPSRARSRIHKARPQMTVEEFVRLLTEKQTLNG